MLGWREASRKFFDLGWGPLPPLQWIAPFPFSASSQRPSRGSRASAVGKIREEEILGEPLLMWEREVKAATSWTFCSRFIRSPRVVCVLVMWSPRSPVGCAPVYPGGSELEPRSVFQPPSLPTQHSDFLYFSFTSSWRKRAVGRKGPLTHS